MSGWIPLFLMSMVVINLWLAARKDELAGGCLQGWTAAREHQSTNGRNSRHCHDASIACRERHGVPYRTVRTMNKVDDGSMLTLRPLEISEGEPYQYEVIGLPTGRGAMLAKLSGVWKILKIEPGKNCAWTGSFVSADDALTSLDGGVGTSNSN